MSRIILVILFCGVMLGTSNRLAAQAYSPTVNMKVQLPDGQTKDLTTHESGLVTVTLKDGEEVGFRPTMMDDAGNRIIVTIFKMGPAEAELGEVETGLGKSPVESKTNPAFKISIAKVAGNTTS